MPIQEDNLNHAPWTYSEISSIRGFQSSGVFHELTCAGCGAVLVVTRFWLECPHRNEVDHIKRCGFRQTWVHRWMADGSWRKAQEIMFASLGLDSAEPEKGD